MSAAQAAREGWTALRDAWPPVDQPFDVLHFGHGAREAWIMQPCRYDEHGILPCPVCPGEHCKRSTITHWRLRNA